jgi:hypothetical protein
MLLSLHIVAFVRLGCILNGTFRDLIFNFVVCNGSTVTFHFQLQNGRSTNGVIPLFSAFRLYVGLHVSPYILYLYSVGVVGDIKGCNTHVTCRACEPSHLWFDSRQRQGFFFLL